MRNDTIPHPEGGQGKSGIIDLAGRFPFRQKIGIINALSFGVGIKSPFPGIAEFIFEQIYKFARMPMYVADDVVHMGDYMLGK